MANSEGIIGEDVRESVVRGQKIYDIEGKQAGTVDMVDREAGYFTARESPFSDKCLYLPFRLITRTDRHQVRLRANRDDLRRTYATPPPRSTRVHEEDGDEIAVTTEPSGYDGTPIVVRRARINDLKQAITVGDRVLSSDLKELGTIKRYDGTEGWMWIVRDTLSNEPGLRAPAVIVDVVERESGAVYLVLSEADLERREDIDPAAAFTEVDLRDGS